MKIKYLFKGPNIIQSIIICLVDSRSDVCDGAVELNVGNMSQSYTVNSAVPPTYKDMQVHGTLGRLKSWSIALKTSNPNHTSIVPGRGLGRIIVMQKTDSKRDSRP